MMMMIMMMMVVMMMKIKMTNDPSDDVDGIPLMSNSLLSSLFLLVPV